VDGGNDDDAISRAVIVVEPRLFFFMDEAEKPEARPIKATAVVERNKSFMVVSFGRVKWIGYRNKHSRPIRNELCQQMAIVSFWTFSLRDLPDVGSGLRVRIFSVDKNNHLMKPIT
jgi:hypothetical protein